MNKEILVKYLNNSCTDKEFDELVRWVEKDASNKEGERWGFEDWKSFEPDDTLENGEKYSALLDKIHHEINLKKQTRQSRVFTIAKVTNWLSRAAAILFIPLFGALLYMLSNNNFQAHRYTDLAVDSLEIIAPIGSRTVVQLSDGTEVNLNYGSKIKYPRNFTGDTREISLVGEAYFDVAHNPDRPFIVKTGKLDVKALGTEFNVHAYPDDDVIETTLVEGKVVIERAISDNKNQAIGTMVPGQHVSFNLNSGKTSSIKGKIEKYIAWKDGKLVFDNEPLTGVAEKLGRMFNVEIEVADEVKNYSYTVTLVDDPLLLILDLMTEVTDISYKVYPRTKLADGTFSKQKIRIKKRQ
jgi:transmembrane sensor